MANNVYYKIKITSNDKINKADILNSLGIQKVAENRNSYYIDLNDYVKIPDDVIQSTDHVTIRAISKYIYENKIEDEVELIKLKSIEDYIDKKVSSIKNISVTIDGIQVNKGLSLLEYVKEVSDEYPILDSVFTARYRLWGSSSTISSVAIGENDDNLFEIYFRVSNHPLTDFIHSLIIKRIKDTCQCDVTMIYMEEFMNYIGKIYYNGCTNHITLDFINTISDVFDIIRTFHEEDITVQFGGYNEYTVNPDLLNIIKYKKVKTLQELLSVINESKLRLFSSEITEEMIDSDFDVCTSEHDYKYMEDEVWANLYAYINSNFDSAVISEDLISFMFKHLFTFVNRNNKMEVIDNGIS